jgi:hypothetical protein
VAVLKQKYPNVKALRDCTLEMLESVHGQLSPVVYRRAHHGISEDVRTLEAVRALEKGDFVTVGARMTESHASLRDDYEVSCEELDFLVAEALKEPGVLGSRMTGGGFGGCTVTLVEKSAVPALVQHLKTEYKQKMNTDCDCYEAVPSAGAGVIDLKSGEQKVITVPAPTATTAASILSTVSPTSTAAPSSSSTATPKSSASAAESALNAWSFPVFTVGIVVGVSLTYAFRRFSK